VSEQAKAADILLKLLDKTPLLNMMLQTNGSTPSSLNRAENMPKSPLSIKVDRVVV